MALISAARFRPLYNGIMQGEWHKYSPRDSKTYPKENIRVEMRDADGTQFSGGYLAGSFVHRGIVSGNTADVPESWRYAQ